MNERKTLKHGTRTTYQYYGCRCNLCRAAENAYQREYYWNNPEHRQRMLVRFKTRYMKRQPCEVCGEPNTEGHHDDYNKAEVRWLCKPHHIEADNAKREKESANSELI